MKHLIPLALLATLAPAALAQTTRPTTRPSGQVPDVDAMMRTLLVPERPRATPLAPAPDPPPAVTADRIVKPNPPPQNLIREDTLLMDYVGRLTRNADGQQEFTFDSDGQTLSNPPMIVLPNRKLMDMEDVMKRLGQDLKFRISGVVTEYNGRNYILLNKAVAQQQDNK